MRQFLKLYTDYSADGKMWKYSMDVMRGDEFTIIIMPTIFDIVFCGEMTQENVAELSNTDFDVKIMAHLFRV